MYTTKSIKAFSSTLVSLKSKEIYRISSMCHQKDSFVFFEEEYHSNHSFRRFFFCWDISASEAFSFLTFFHNVSSSCLVSESPQLLQTMCLISEWYFIKPPQFRCIWRYKYTFWAASHKITNLFFLYLSSLKLIELIRVKIFYCLKL